MIGACLEAVTATPSAGNYWRLSIAVAVRLPGYCRLDKGFFGPLPRQAAVVNGALSAVTQRRLSGEIRHSHSTPHSKLHEKHVYCAASNLTMDTRPFAARTRHRKPGV